MPPIVSLPLVSGLLPPIPSMLAVMVRPILTGGSPDGQRQPRVRPSGAGVEVAGYNRPATFVMAPSEPLTVDPEQLWIMNSEDFSPAAHQQRSCAILELFLITYLWPTNPNRSKSKRTTILSKAPIATSSRSPTPKKRSSSTSSMSCRPRANWWRG